MLTVSVLGYPITEIAGPISVRVYSIPEVSGALSTVPVRGYAITGTPRLEAALKITGAFLTARIVRGFPIAGIPRLETIIPRLLACGVAET